MIAEEGRLKLRAARTDDPTPEENWCSTLCLDDERLAMARDDNPPATLSKEGGPPSQSSHLRRTPAIITARIRPRKAANSCIRQRSQRFVFGTTPDQLGRNGEVVGWSGPRLQGVRGLYSTYATIEAQSPRGTPCSQPRIFHRPTHVPGPLHVTSF